MSWEKKINHPDNCLCETCRLKALSEVLGDLDRMKLSNNNLAIHNLLIDVNNQLRKQYPSLYELSRKRR